MLLKILALFIVMKVASGASFRDPCYESRRITFLYKFDCFENEGKYVFNPWSVAGDTCQSIRSTTRSGEKAVVCTEGPTYENEDKCHAAIKYCAKPMEK